MKSTKMTPAIAAKKPVVKAKKASPKDTLREAFTDTTLVLERTRVELESTKELLASMKEIRDAVAARLLEHTIERDGLRDICSHLKVEQENLRAMLEHQQRANISLRAEMEVSRARGYIAGMKGEPFDRTVLDVSGPMNAERQVTDGKALHGHMANLRRPLGDFVT